MPSQPSRKARKPRYAVTEALRGSLPIHGRG